MNTTTKTFWNLDKNDILNICIAKIKYANWEPMIEDIGWYSNQTLGSIRCILQTKMGHHRIKFDDDRLDVSSSSSGVAKGYAWAQIHTNKCGYSVEYRIYFATENNRIQFCNKLDPIDKLIATEQTKFAPW